jgi:hypothetical protein
MRWLKRPLLRSGHQLTAARYPGEAVRLILGFVRDPSRRRAPQARAAETAGAPGARDQPLTWKRIHSSMPAPSRSRTTTSSQVSAMIAQARAQTRRSSRTQPLALVGDDDLKAAVLEVGRDIGSCQPTSGRWATSSSSSPVGESASRRRT